MAITAETRTELVQLYVTMFNAAPSNKILSSLVAAAEAGDTVQQMADMLAKESTFASDYPSWQTAKEFSNELMTKMFAGGTVSTADFDAAVDYVAGQITAGALTKTSAAVALTSYLASADGIANAAYGSASQAYQNKVAVAEYYTITKEQGDASAADLAAAISGVTDAADSVSTKQAALDVVATPVVPKQTLSLTATSDSLTGGLGDDSFIGSSTTFNSDDILNGGDGADMLTVSAAGAATPIANLTSIETLKITNGAAGDYAVNMITSVGVTDVMSRLSSGRVSFNNLQADANVHAYGVQGGAIVAAGFLNTLASGTAKTDTLNLIADAGSNVAFQVSGTTDTNEFEIINLLSKGSQKNTVGITDLGGNAPAALTTLTVTGTADTTMTLAGGPATGATYSGTANTGKQAITWGGNFNTITTGAAADSITLNGAVFGNTAAKTIDGGDGTDSISIDASVSTLVTTAEVANHTLTGIESATVTSTVLTADNADTTVAIAADKLGLPALNTAITNFDTNNTDTAAISLTGLTTEVVTFQSLEATAQAVNTFTAALKDATGLADTLTLTSVDPAAGRTTANRLDTLTASNIESITLNLLAPDAIAATGVLTNNGTDITSLAIANATKLTLVGEGIGIVATEMADPAGLTNAEIDASAMTGRLVLGAGADFKTTNGDNFTVTLGSGKNTVNFGVAMTASDKVIGTTGTDTVTLTEAADIKPTMTGIDKVVMTPGAAALTDTIDATNFTDVAQIQIATIAHVGNEGLIVKGLSTGQAIDIDVNAGGGNQDVFTLTNALNATATAALTGTTLSLSGGVATAGAAGISVVTGGGAVSIADNNKNTATGASVNSTLTLSAPAALQPVTSLTLTGGGMVSSTVRGILTLKGTTNINAASIDATGLSSDLVIDGLTTFAAGSLTLSSGNNKVTLAQADLARDAFTVNGGDGKDTAIFTLADITAADTDLRPGLNGIETLTITQTVSTNDQFNYNFNLSDTDSVSTINVTLAGSDDSLVIAGASGDVALKMSGTYNASTDGITVNGATGLTMTNGARVGATASDITAANATAVTIELGNSSNIAFDAATFAKAITVNLGGDNVVPATGLAYAGTIAIATLSAAKATDLVVDTSQGNVTIPTLTAAKLVNITATGDGTFNIGGTGATTTLLANLDASANTGVVTVGDAIDFASSAAIKTGTANDSVTLSSLTEANVAVDMGEKAADTDTLVLTGANNMGLTVINLASADQMGQLNGSVDSSVQTGIENLTASGLTGSQGITMTGSGDVNILKGTKNSDVIIPGEKADTVHPGSGADTIDLTESTATIDTIKFDAPDLAIKTTVDTITGMGSTDVLSFSTAAGGAFADLHDGDGNTMTVAGASVYAYNVAVDGNTVFANAANNVLIVHNDVSNLALGYGSFTAMRTALNSSGTIKESGNGNFAAGDEIITGFHNTATSTYDFGIMTVVGVDSIKGGDETFEHLISVSSTGITLAQVAAAFDFTA